MKGWQKTASTAGSKEQLLWKSRKERNQYSSKRGTTKEQVEKSSGPPNQTGRCKQGASQLPGTAGEATEEEQRYSKSSKYVGQQNGSRHHNSCVKSPRVLLWSPWQRSLQTCPAPVWGSSPVPQLTCCAGASCSTCDPSFFLTSLHAT